MQPVTCDLWRGPMPDWQPGWLLVGGRCRARGRRSIPLAESKFGAPSINTRASRPRSYPGKSDLIRPKNLKMIHILIISREKLEPTHIGCYELKGAGALNGRIQTVSNRFK